MRHRYDLRSLTEALCDYLDAGYVLDGLTDLDVGWAVEAPMRDRADALHLIYNEDGWRERTLGIPSIWI